MPWPATWTLAAARVLVTALAASAVAAEPVSVAAELGLAVALGAAVVVTEPVADACGAVAVAVGVPAELDDELHPLARAIATALAAIARLTGTPLDAGNLAVLMRPPNLRTVYVLLPS
jgi:hypothetical protein